MAVPSSGNEISILGIFSEVNENDYTAFNQEGETNISLNDLADGEYGTIRTFSVNKPDADAPHAMSEWHSYDHDAPAPSFSSVIANFNLSTTAGGNTTVSTGKSFTLNNAFGDLTATLSFGGSPTAGVTVQISISEDGDPGVAGTSNNATGYVSHGSTATISSVSSGTIYARFRLTSGSGGLASTGVTCTFTNGGVTDEVIVTCAVAK